jgi:hypothetical protein
MKIEKTMVAMALVLASSMATAQRYKCTNGSVVSYQAKPCSGQGSETKLEENTHDKSEVGMGEQVSEDLSIGPIYVKREEESGDYQYYSMKATVQNNTDAERSVSLHYKGIDRDQFQVESFYLRGKIPAKQTRTLTDKSLMKIAEFKRINQWILDK